MKIILQLKKTIKPILFILFSYVIALNFGDVIVFEGIFHKWLLVYFLLGIGYVIGFVAGENKIEKYMLDRLEKEGILWKSEKGEYLSTHRMKKKFDKYMNKDK
ncbi:hypothetical protein HN958_00140 [Candidatus Falkowbacteria bacterium]|jgi:hypothetical protein|nr:hypothetical protein [Candidatus Falkowbacteria bacterium]